MTLPRIDPHLPFCGPLRPCGEQVLPLVFKLKANSQELLLPVAYLFPVTCDLFPIR